MRPITTLACAALVAASGAAPVSAQGFETVTSRDRFVQLVTGRDLTRFAITLGVSPSGEIGGRAFGSQVTGNWNWQGQFFCRTMRWGSKQLDPNCQMVRISGDTIRFISDRGEGRSADLTLE